MIKTKSKDQLNDAIYNEPKFDTNSFNLSIRTRDPLPVVTVGLQGVKKHRETTVAGLTCMWDSGATGRMIKTKHTNYYEQKIHYNKVEYGTAAGVYCMTHDVKVPFCMPNVSGRNIINHRLHVNNYKGESGLGYDMITGCDLMVQLGLMADFKRKLLQWDGATVHIK